MLKLFLRIVCICIFLIQYLQAQDTTRTHTVKKGETIYQIGRLYNVSPKTLLQLNPDTGDVIYVNDLIILPGSSAINNNESGLYTVKRGETKFGLSKKFGITINALESENPHIKNGLQAGHILNVLGVEKASTASTTNLVNESVENEMMPYLVKKGETLWGISKAHNTTVAQLRSANRDAINNVLQAGSTIRVPIKPSSKNDNTYQVIKGDTKYGLSKRFNITISELEHLNPQIKQQLYAGSIINISQNNESNNVVESSSSKETIANSNSETNDSNSISQNTSSQGNDNLNPKVNQPIANTAEGNTLYASIDRTEQNNFLMFVPFTENQFEYYKQNPSEFAVLDNKSLKDNIEFHRGAKMAIDSIKSLGLQCEVKINALENPNEKNTVSAKINTSEMQTYDGIIVPFYLNETEYIASLLKTDNIPVITTYAENNRPALDNLFETLPSPSTQRLTMLNYLKSKNANIIVIADRDRQESKALIEETLPNAKFLRLRTNGSFNENELLSMLDANQKNYVVLETDKPSVVISSTNLLLGEISSHQIQIAVLEQSLIPDVNRVSNRRLRILNMVYPAFSKNELKNAPLKFSLKYRHDYNSEPTINVLMGFDMIYDTLLRIYQAENFAETAKNMASEHMYLNFDYKQQALGRFSNNNLTILEYNTNNDNAQDD